MPLNPIPRRSALKAGSLAFLGAIFVPRLLARNASRKEFNVLDFGARGDGQALDTVAVQKTIDAAAAAGRGARVIVPDGRKFKVGKLSLASHLELYLGGGSELLAAEAPADYDANATLLAADNCEGISLAGHGAINGRALTFMTHFDEKEEWWRPKEFRPRLAVFTGCRDLQIKNMSFIDAPSWTLHLVGCEKVSVDSVTIKNRMDLPNCDGIDPDHCRQVEIKNCHVTCGDDAIVIKATRQGERFGGSSDISVRDCVLLTQDSGLKIGTETVSDISNIRFEDCKIESGCRGLTIQLRDAGNVKNVSFKNISFESRYHSFPWWGRGEGISLTAIPRTPETKVGRISEVSFKNITGRAENSVRVSGSAPSRISDVRFEDVDLTMDRWTRYPGGVWDNRPTTAMVDLEPHATPAIHVRHADRVGFKNCQVRWGKNAPDYFTHALEAHDVTELDHASLHGESAFPKVLAATSVRA